jgi:proteic killer suppression protein
MMSLLRKKPQQTPGSASSRRGPARVERDHASKIERILAALDQATLASEMDLPGFRLAPLKGKKKGHYSVWVSGNWCMTFRFHGHQAVDIDYIDSL